MPWTCQQLQENLIALEEGDGSPLDLALARLHLSLCVRCQRYAAQLKVVRSALGELRVDLPPPDRAEAARALFREAHEGPSEG